MSARKVCHPSARSPGMASSPRGARGRIPRRSCCTSSSCTPTAFPRASSRRSRLRAARFVGRGPEGRTERAASEREHVASDASSSSRPSRTALQTLREALQLFRTVADGYAKRRLLLALALVAAGALLAALTPIALKLVVDSLAEVAAPAPTSPQPGSGAGAMPARLGQRRAPAPTRRAVAAARPAFEYSSSSDSSSTSSSHCGSDTCSWICASGTTSCSAVSLNSSGRHRR